MPPPLQSPLHTSSDSVLTPARGGLDFGNEETEARRGQWTCPRSHRWLRAELGPVPGPVSPRSCFSSPQGPHHGRFQEAAEGPGRVAERPSRSGGRLDRAHIPSWEGSATLLSLGNNRTNSSAQVYLLSVAPQSLDSGWGLPPNPQRGRP